MLIISIIASLLIEILEFILQRGSMELADLLHNTLGMMLGYSVLNIVLIFLKKRNRYKNNQIFIPSHYSKFRCTRNNDFVSNERIWEYAY